jgi:hypothetical protein
MRYASPVRWEGQSLLCPYPYRHPKDPARRVRCDSCRCTYDRERLWPYMGDIAKQNRAIPKCLGSVSDHLYLCISQLQETVHPMEQELEQHRTPGLAAPDHTVPYGTDLSRTLSQALRARLGSVCPYGTGLQTICNGI